MRPALFCLCTFIALCSAAQDGDPIDSLLQVLEHAREDTNKVRLLNTIAFHYRTIDNGKGLRYAGECFELADRMDWQPGRAMCLNVLGNNHKTASDYDNALEAYQNSLRIYEELGKKREAAIVLMNIGTIYRPLKEYDKALEYYRRALAIAEELGLEKVTAQLYGNIGVVHYERKEYDLQKEVNEKALAIFQKIGDRHNTAWILSNLGDVHAAKKEWDIALAHQQQAIAIYEQLGDRSYKGTSLQSIGKYYLDQAVEAPEDRTRRQLVDSALTYLQQARTILHELNDLDYLKDVNFDLYKTQALVGDYEAALGNYTEYVTLKDSVHSMELRERIAHLETQRELEVRDKEIFIQQLKKRTERIYLGGGMGALLVIIGLVGAGYRRQKRSNIQLSREKQRSEELLHNILPEEVAEELKAKGNTDARLYQMVTVMFTDFKGFTHIAEKLGPQELVAQIDECFRGFDAIVERFNVEKIKTIGDAYMAAGGLPVTNTTNAVDVVNAALAIQEHMHRINERKRKEGKEVFEIRIGVHTGPVVAGIVGVKKFAYDIWGDTVNLAARMESSGEAGRVNISGSTYALVKDRFECIHRGRISAKNKGEVDMYFVSESIPSALP
jgi:class 3 adenylate cyclase/Tfp pilus assembly protein PilF